MDAIEQGAAERQPAGADGGGWSAVDGTAGPPAGARSGTPASPAERAARGRAARAAAPRRFHANWAPAAARPGPITLLEQQAATRVPSLVPIRYGRMLASPFAFFRGAASIMASDLAGTPHSGIQVQLCGDAHLSNFGVFGTPERNLVFDINDFDETLPGPWEWDVKRLAASFAVAGRERGFSARERARVVTTAVRKYRTTMRAFAGRRQLDVWYAHLNIDRTLAQARDSLSSKKAARVEAALAKARSRDNLRAAARLTHVVNGARRIISDPPLVVPIEELAYSASEPDMASLRQGVQDVLFDYRRTLPPGRRYLLDQFELVHVAHKVVGVGSVGSRAWIVLLRGRDDGDPLLLQVKEAQPSVLEGALGKSAYENCGQRVVAGQQLMQAASDIFLGWTQVPSGRSGPATDFYVRQLHDWKGSADIDPMRPRGMALYGRLCGWTLARAHARSGDRIAIAAYLGGGDVFDRALAAFAEAYADQNERDYQALVAAVKSGRLAAHTDL